MDIKTERFIRELDRRTSLWERMKANAERRIALDNVVTPLLKIDVEVAERALVRIAKKKDELLGVPLDVKMEEAPKKRAHKRPKALFELAPVKDVEEKEKHDA